MQKHFILTLGRSGSNTLRTMLNEHPAILNVGEVLGPWTKMQKIRRLLGAYRSDDTAYLDTMLSPSAALRMLVAGRNAGRILGGRPRERKVLAATESIGVKDFATLLDTPELRSFLRDRDDIKVIGLCRRGVLERTISWKMLDKTGVVSTRVDTDGQRQLTIPPEELLADLRTVGRENELLKQMLDEIPDRRKIVVYYEDLYRDAESRNATIDSIFAFLGQRPHEVDVKMRKIITQPAAQVIRNRADCARHLTNTEFEGLLDLEGA
jgi:hypothetical protein